MGQPPIAGKSSSPGIAIGKLWRAPLKNFVLPKRRLEKAEVPGELIRTRTALEQTALQLEALQQRLCRFREQAQIDILESHQMLLQDPLLYQQLEHQIQNAAINAEWALEKTVEHFKMELMNLSHPQAQARLQDMEAVSERLLHTLTGQAETNWHAIPPGRWIVAAEALPPSAIAHFPKDRVIGFVTAEGGPTSHTIIIARSLNFAAIVGIGLEALQEITTETPCILDGFEGHLLLEPTPSQHQRSETLANKHHALEALLLKESHKPAATSDGQSIRIEANMEWPEEIPVLLNHGAEGVGLYRTEYLFMDRVAPPTEEEQFEIYRKILTQMQKKPVTIRTVDLPETDGNNAPPKNPALGLRGLRRSLYAPATFRTQLSALLRASSFGTLRILFPMVTSLEEFQQARRHVAQVAQELGIPPVPLGAMIEVPSAALIADHLAGACDFFAIGTNDLIQYTFATDRTDPKLAQLYGSFHPAIFQLLPKITQAAKKARIPLSLCGELAGDPDYLPLLIGLEIETLSMTPLSIPMAKRRIGQLSGKKCGEVMEAVSHLKTAKEIENHLKNAFGNLLDSTVREG